MKKLLLLMPVVAMFAMGLVGCKHRGKHAWTHEQRKEMREALRDYRKMVYLNNLTEAEYLLFIDEVANELETDYPVYTTFIAMPGAGDTVDLYVVETIVDELNTDARNMRHIFPYRFLVAEGMLPSGLDMHQQHQFYSCLAGSVNNTYLTMENFVAAILADTTSTASLQQLIAGCANSLFGWTITEIDIIETD
ncbi:MAG: hypothetical protein Q4A18_00035 [Rikenellaceae bacterium]|nr:hypothetical protein [Rikenellaceae bacterium]